MPDFGGETSMPDDSPAAPSANAPLPLFTCPYCGGPTPDQPRCVACNGLLDPLSRQATQNAMGPWFVRDEQQPHRPGCSFETILTLIARGKITTDAILRGPTTAQFWYPAKRVPGVANRLGVCHACQAAVQDEASCPSCHASFEVEGDRQTLGLMPIRLIPGQATEGPAPTQRSAPPAPALPTTTPRAAEARRAAAAAAKRRTSALLGATVGFAIVGVMVLTLVWVTRDAPGGATPRVSGSAAIAAPPDQTPSSSTVPDAPSAALVPPTEAVLPRAVSTQTPPESAPIAQPASPPVRDPDLDTLRKTRLP
jgi:hypothetical protein